MSLNSDAMPSMTTALSPWASAASWWTPTHLVESGWIEHAPFAAWLIDVLRPSTIVELGTHNGYSFFTFCEAAQRLEAQARLYGIDTWKGDDHAGFYDETVFTEVNAIRESRYADNAVFLRGYFDDFVDTFATASIDLIHIDGRHSYEDVRHDYESWLPRLSPHGIVLFHDIAVKDRDFGVWKLWEELASGTASFSFQHGHGLGVLAPGSAPTALNPLFDAAGEQLAEIRSFYEHLGGRISAAVIEAGSAAATRQHVKNLEDAIASAHTTLDSVFTSRSWRWSRPLRWVGSLYQTTRTHRSRVARDR